MRWLFGLLLLANLVLFLWQSTGPSASRGSPSLPPATMAGVPTLVLVGERRGTPATAAAETTETVREPVPEPRATAAPIVVAGPESETVEPPTAEPQVAPTSRPDASTEQTARASDPPEPAPIEPPAVATECVRLGPFASEGEARAAARYLSNRRVYPTLAVEGEERDLRYIVYLPAAPSRAAALERLRELKAKGIDSFVMGGSLRNAISLGVFSQHESAQRLIREMEERGYQVEIHEQRRESPVYWLELGPKNTDRLSRELAAALKRRYPDASLEAGSCP